MFVLPSILILATVSQGAEYKLRLPLGLREQAVYIPHDEVNGYYSLIDMFIFPRQRMRLTELVTPLKPLEAMSMGKAVLASNVGGHKELIEDGKTGLLFAAENNKDLVAVALKLATDPALRRHLSWNGREYVRKNRCWLELVRTYLELYEQLVGVSGERQLH